MKDFQLTRSAVVKSFTVVSKGRYSVRLSPLKPHAVCCFLGDTWRVMKDLYDSESAQEVCRREAGGRWERSGGIDIRGLVRATISQ